MSDKTLIYGALGVGIIWLLTRPPSAQAVAAQQAALADAAALQSQRISNAANQSYVNTGANLISSLVGDFT